MYAQYFNVEIYLFISFEGVNGYFLHSFIVNDSLYILWYTFKTFEEAVYKDTKYWQYLL
jgi:hypothetical protein